MSLYRTAMKSLAIAAAYALGQEPSSSSAGEAPPLKPRKTGNPSGHTPHQGKREMERRRKRMTARAAITQDDER